MKIKAKYIGNDIKSKGYFYGIEYVLIFGVSSNIGIYSLKRINTSFKSYPTLKDFLKNWILIEG